MSALSHLDIEREIYEGNILIYPFSQKNLKASSYNLTVSRVAYKVLEKSEAQQKISYESAYDNDRQVIIIPAHAIVIIWTNESIYVSKKISGTYHSKVGLVAQGLGHIGTTLDPGYLGSSAITVQNHSDYPIELNPEIDTFATLMFQYVKTEASKDHGNHPGRTDLGLNINDEDKKWLEQEFRNTQTSLKDILKQEKDDSDYKSIINKLKQNRLSSRWLYPLAPYLVFSILILVPLTVKFPYYDKIVPIFMGAAGLQFINDINTLRKEK
jgi:deoxycytidine triphosphate deaminase